MCLQVGEKTVKTVFIQHGMNFYSEAYTTHYQSFISAAGFRVIAVDRIGYGKSTSRYFPTASNFVAANMKSLLDELEIDEVAIVGHSMGGMTVSRFAMVYPDITTHVVMVNQIGLTDQRQSRSWRDPFAGGGTTTYQSILRGHQNYFPTAFGHQSIWNSCVDNLDKPMSGEWNRVAQVRRLQGQMLYDDPVVYDWQHIETKALVIGGEEDGLVDDFPTLRAQRE